MFSSGWRNNCKRQTSATSENVFPQEDHVSVAGKAQDHCSLCGNVFARLVSLCLHDPLHVSGPAVLTGDQSAGRVGQPLGEDGLLDLVEPQRWIR